MSYLTTRPLLWFPAQAVGIAIAGVGSAWANSAWTTLIPSTPTAMVLAHLVVTRPGSGGSGGPAANTEAELDIGWGAAGSEILVTTWRWSMNSGLQGDHTIPLAIPTTGIGPNVRVAARLRLSTTATDAWSFALGYFDGTTFDGSHFTVAAQKTLPAAANGVGISTIGSPPWTNSAWIQMTTGFTDPTILAGVTFANLTSTDFEVDIGIGAAGLETVVTSMHGLGGATGFPGSNFPRPYRIPANTRIAVRARGDTTDAAANIALLYYGDVIDVVDPPDGGGTVEPADNPDAGLSLCGAEVPFVWHVLQTDSGERVYAPGDNALGAVFQEHRVISSGVIHRALSGLQGNVETVTQTIVLSDTDRFLRGLGDAGTLLNKRVDTYLSSRAGMIAGATPRRVNQGQIAKYKPLSDLQFSLDLEDFFSALVNEVQGTNVLPQRKLTTADFPNLATANPTKVNAAVPILYGLCSDEELGSSALGVVPATYVGDRTVDGALWREMLICGHAVKQIQSVFVPSGGGLSTGTAEPSRTKVTSEGADMLIPGYANWIARVGANPWVEYNGNRYTVIYMLGPKGDLASSGQVPIALNVAGIEDVGDGSGDLIDSLPLQIAHLLVNWMLQSYTGGSSWLSVPTIGSPAYGRVRTTSFEAAKTASEARLAGGYLGAFMLGWEGQFHAFRDVMQDLLESCDLQQFMNKDGQIAVSMLDTAATAVKAWQEPFGEILKGSFDSDRSFDELANQVTYRYQRRYVAPVATLTPNSGQFLPASIKKEAVDWLVTPDPIQDTTSISNSNRRARNFDLDLPCVRAATTAASVAANVLARRGGKGPQYAQHAVNLCGTDVELGDVQTVTHFEGPTASGWTDRPVRVEGMDLDCDALTQSFMTQRDLGEL